MFEDFNAEEVLEYREALRLTDVLLSGIDPNGLSDSTIRRWLKRRTEADAGNPRALLKKHSQSGRKPIVEPTKEDIIALKAAFVRSNRSRDKGSKTLAARMLAKQGKLSPEVANAILFKGGDPANGPRAFKTPPKSILDAMHVPPALMRAYRSPRNAMLAGLYAPGSMRMTTADDGTSRRFEPGERQSWDDASINFCVCVPWPFGGDKCSDKYGVKIGRFQLLAGIDDASDFAPGFTFVMRPLSSYRKQDVGAAMFRVFRDTYAPDSVMLEGGSWQSDMVLRFLELTNIGWDDAKGRPHKKLIEGYWNRLWTVLSQVAPDGQIGRYRGEMEKENAHWIRCQQGRENPENFFPKLNEALNILETGFRYLNEEQVESRHYGKWIPSEMHGQYISDNPRKALERSLAWLVAPEQHERKVLRSGMVCATVVSPFGVALPYHFSAPELMEFEGQRIRLYFDPWETPIKATITLAQDFMGLKTGHVITHFANCLNSVPEICEAANAAKSTDRELIAEMSICGIENTLRIKRYMQTDLRTETVLLGLRGGKKKTTEIRGSDNSLLRVESGIGVGDGATVVSSGAVSEILPSISNAENRRREREETDWDAMEKFEAANRREFVGV